MNKIFYLSTCTTCKRILKDWEPLTSLNVQDVKTHPIGLHDLEALRALSGSYESLFNRRAQRYKERGLKDKTLIENDYKTLILEHYSFLKRPILWVPGMIFAGNAKKTVEAAKLALQNTKQNRELL